ncbi:MAG: urea ABC transporter ATP-binding protein UrtD [Rhodobacterales bacterium]|nr:urea ABC transporter ATP-binding protein UrtD [Rhodobacterales bacterium]
MTVALLIDGVGVDFGGFKAVDGFSMSIDEGELMVLLGANGAGKTTLMDLISGKTKATEGHIYIDETEITNWAPHRIVQQGLGRKFQIPSVFRELSLRQNMEVAATVHPAVLRNLGSRLPADRVRRIDEVLELVGLDTRQNELAGNLSHGETQWLELGMLIVQNPKIILLDEPTAGMTQAETLKTSRIINDLKGRHTLLVVEHDMSFVREIAHHITVMHLGKFLASGTIAEIETNEDVRRAYLGSGGIK